MKDFKNKFEEVLKEDLNFDPSAEDAAFQDSLDDNTSSEDFNTPGMPPGTGAIDKAVEGVEEVKRWISVIDKFVTYVNGDQDTSVVKKLASLDQDDTAWAGVVSDAKTIINIAGKLAEYKQKLQGRISTIDHKVKQLQQKKSKVNS
jgi:hypothetical protein